MLDIGRDIYSDNKSFFDQEHGLEACQVESIAKLCFENKMNYANTISFLVFAVTQFPREKALVCNVLRKINAEWMLNFDNYLFY